MDTNSVLIVGAGQAGAQTAYSLRQNGFDGRVAIIGEEPSPPYQRPPLSKAYLQGQLAQDRLWLKPKSWYRENDVNLVTNTRVTRIDFATNKAHAHNDREFFFEHLVFATGSRPRKLKVAGADLDGVFDLRTLQNVDVMRAAFSAGRRIVILGGGYIGLEAAAVARKMGLSVTLIEIGPRVLSRVAGEEISAYFTNLHRSHGVEIIANANVVELCEHDGRVSKVRLDNGQEVDCDFVLVGIGVSPNIELASSLGIACDNGIVVDDHARTSVERVYAAGDCTIRPLSMYGRADRLESVHNAIEQGKQVAASITNSPQPKLDCPWFWSDQYSVKLQIAGLSRGHTHSVLRGSPEHDKFAIFYFADDKLLGCDAVNSPQEFLVAKKLILSACPFDPLLLADIENSMKDIAAMALSKG